MMECQRLDPDNFFVMFAKDVLISVRQNDNTVKPVQSGHPIKPTQRQGRH